MTVQSLTYRLLQHYWRWTRGVTLGAQGLVVDAEGRVLLVRHSYKPGWAFPGGGVERGEDAETTLVRELEEETGVATTAAPELYGLYTNFQNFPGDHIAFYRVRSWQRPRVPAPNREIVEQGFFGLDRLPAGLTRGTERRLAEVFRAAPRSAIW